MPTKTPKITKKTKVIQTRLDAELVDKATEIFEYNGLSTTDAVRVFLKSVVNHEPLPLNFSKPKIQEIKIPENPPILELEPKKLSKIEKILDDYYAGNLETVTLDSDEDIKSYFKNLNQA